MTASPSRPAGGLSDRLIGSVGMLAFWDRFGLPPMLVVLASSTGLRLGQTVQLFAVYTLLYAVGQPLWGLLSDRLGRLVVLRTALLGTTVGAVASTLTSDFTGLLLARGFTGLMIGCLYPTMLTVIGDTREGVERSRSLSSLQSWSALGSTLTTVLAGTLAAFVDWRVVFGSTAVGTLAVLWALRAQHGPPPQRSHRAVGAALAPWALVVYLLAALEGAVLFGGLSYVVPAMQHVGVSVTLAGLLAAVYGLGIMLGAGVVRRLVHRTTRTRMILLGGSILVLAYAVAWLSGTAASLTVTAVLVGLANSVVHVSLQAWATEVAPTARATSVGLFAGSLFLGSSLASFLTAGLAEQGRFGLIYALLMAVGAGFTLLAATAYRRWEIHLTGRAA